MISADDFDFDGCCKALTKFDTLWQCIPGWTLEVFIKDYIKQVYKTENVDKKDLDQIVRVCEELVNME